MAQRTGNATGTAVKLRRTNTRPDCIGVLICGSMGLYCVPISGTGSSSGHSIIMVPPLEIGNEAYCPCRCAPEQSTARSTAGAQFGNDRAVDGNRAPRL